MGLKRKADEQLLTSERMRQGKALDQTTEAIAKIMNRAHPGEVEDIVQEWHEERSEALADWSDVDGALWLRELQVERKHAEPLQHPLKFERPVEIERK